ncbi:MAG: S41 family peptidase [Candidatus Saccharimonadales bacterium]
MDGASRGLVAAAGDKYTVFMDDKEAKAFNDELSGAIGGGVGAEIGVRAGQPTIVRVLPNNPAAKVGLLACDTIIAVNDTSVVGKDSSAVATLIRGEEGTTVKLSIVRDGQAKQFNVTRATVSNPSVYSDITDGVGRMTITRFDTETGRLSRQIAKQFKAKNVKSVILDLRGNGGGYLEAAQDVAGLWLDNKVVVSERTGGRVVDELRSGSDTVLEGVPTIVLVDERSASASEIVAGALQDNKAARLVGVKTFGKGTVQKVLNLGAGTQLKVTIARWYTPNGKNITKEGIKPDKVVTLSSDQVNAGKDPQLDAALRMLAIK